MNEPDELSRYLDPRNSRRIGAEVLVRGLPALPDDLTYQMSVPTEYWAASQCAVVLFPHFSQWEDGHVAPMVKIGTFFRGGPLERASHMGSHRLAA